MGLFKKIKHLVGNEAVEAKVTHIDENTPEVLDSPPYSFKDALHAVRQGNSAKIQDYLKFNRRYALCKHWDECTLLHEAAAFARAEIVEALLKHQADVNALYKDQTPLHFAIEGSAQQTALKDDPAYFEYLKQRALTVQHLLHYRADWHLPNKLGELPIHLTAKLGYSDLLELLVEAGSDLNCPIGSGQTNSPNEGRTPLLLAAKYNKDKVTLEILLKKKANPNLRDKDPGYAPLHYVAAHYSVTQPLDENYLRGLTELLLDYQAEINLNTVDGQTALHLAVQRRHVGVVSALLDRGANPYAKNRHHLMPMGLAAREGNVEMLKYFLERKIDPYQSLAIFHAATCPDDDRALRWFLDSGVDVNLVLSNGCTLLYYAISSYSLVNVKLLIERGADVHLAPSGMTLLKLAFARWGDVVNLSDERVSEEREQKSHKARDIIELLGGFKQEKQKFLF